MTDLLAPTRAERRKAETRRRLLQAAGEVYAEVGVEGATIGAITDRADVGLGTFYLHFSDKDALAAAVGQDLLGRIAAAVDAAADEGDADGDVLAAHRAATRAVCRVAAEEARLLHALYRWHPAGGTATLRQLFVARLAAVLARAMDAGGLRAEDPDLAAHALLGMYAECILHWASTGRDDWSTLADFLERTGIAALT